MTDRTTPPPAEEIGDRDYPIWLLGDSPSDSKAVKKMRLKEPKYLTPLDPRHPTRHKIWTPILYVIQRRLFAECGRRLDDRKLYIRNAVCDSKLKLEIAKKHGEEVAKSPEEQLRETEECRNIQIKEMIKLHDLLNRPLKPLFVFCFGGFAYQFASWAQEGKEEILYPNVWKKWEIPDLSTQFDERIKIAKLNEVTLLPLLHESVARQFGFAHEHFSGGGDNYFEYVGEKIADVLIRNLTNDRINEILLPVKPKGAISE